MKPWLRSHGSIAAAIAIAVTLTSVFGYIAVVSFLGVLDPNRIDSRFRQGALFGSSGTATDVSGTAQNASALIALLFGVVVLVSIIVITGLIRRQSWARESAMVIYGFLGILSIAVSASGITADPPASSAWLGMLTGVANLTIVGLLLLRSTARDFDPILRLRSQARETRQGGAGA